MSKKIVALLLALVMLLGTTAMAEELTSLLGYGIGGDTQGPLTGWVGDLWATKGLQLEALTVSNAQEKMATMLASGDLPDLVRFNNWDDFNTAIQAGYLVNLDEHIDKLPNTVKYASAALDYTRQYRSNGTGNLYGVPDNVGPNTFETDAGCYAFNIRWDIYAQAGYPEAKTLEDVIDVFKAMKEVYPKTDDGLETYAINTFAEWDSGTRFSFANAVLCNLGYYEGSQTYFIDYHIATKKVNSIFDDDSAFLRALKFLYTLNQEGLMDPDSLTQTYVNSQSKIENGQYFASWWGGYQSAFDTLEKKNSEPPVGFAPLMFDEYAASTMGNTPIGSAWPLTISVNATDLDACLTYVDANADPEFLYGLYNGPKGVFWDIDENGKTYATEAFYEYSDTGKYILPSGQEYSYWNGRYTLRSTFLTTEDGPIDGTYAEQSRAYRYENKLQAAWSEHYGGEYKFPIDKIIAEDRLALRPLAFISFMPQMSDDMKLMRDAIGGIVQSNGWKMVYAANEDEFNAIWAQTKAEAEALGVKDIQDWAVTEMETAFANAAQYE